MFPTAPACSNLSRITAAAATAYHLYVLVVEKPAPQYDLEKIALQQTIRDQQREINSLKEQLQKQDMRLHLRRASANKTSIGVDMIFKA